MRTLESRLGVGLGVLAVGLLLLPQIGAAQWSTAPSGLESALAVTLWGAIAPAPPLDRGIAIHGIAARLQVLSPAAGPIDVAPSAVQEADDGSGWRRGFVVGGLIGGAVGLLAFLLVDSLPCDSCAGVSDSFASGAGPEFVLGFGLVGATIGALVGR